MSSDTTTSRWSGGVSPYGISWQKMMMWWFIVNDGLLFAGFVASYGFTRMGTDSWPVQSSVFSIPFITLMTFILITSSATMASAVAAAKANDHAATKKFILMTLAGGLAFLVMQGIEWGTLISHGARLGSNPWGERAFGAYFFAITGLHGTHVLIGTIVLSVVALKAAKGKATAEGVELAGLYWHFVDLVWVFVFGGFYLI